MNKKRCKGPCKEYLNPYMFTVIDKQKGLHDYTCVNCRKKQELRKKEKRKKEIAERRRKNAIKKKYEYGETIHEPCGVLLSPLKDRWV